MDSPIALLLTRIRRLRSGLALRLVATLAVVVCPACATDPLPTTTSDLGMSDDLLGSVVADAAGQDATAPIMFRRAELKRDSSAAFGASAVVATDFNRDGLPDVAVTDRGSNNHGGGQVEVYLNRGAGQFASSFSRALIEPVRDLITADFDGDGRPDLGVVDLFGATAMFGDGTGQFPTALSVSFGPNFTVGHVFAADLSRTGRSDFCAADRPGLLVRRANADRTFGPLEIFAAGGTAQRGAPGTFSAAPTRDVVLAMGDWASWSLTVLFGNAKQGSFYPPENHAGGSGTVSGVLVADLNHDGRDDIIALADPGYAVFMGGNASLLVDGERRPTGGGPGALGDLNGDGWLDLVIAGDFGLKVCFGNGDGTFQTALSFPGKDSPAALAIADFDRNGREDVVVASGYDGSLIFFYQ